MKDNGLVVISIVAAAALVGVLIYLVVNRRRQDPAQPVPEAGESQNYVLRTNLPGKKDIS